MRSARGSSLGETVLAMALLAAGVIVAVTLFHSGLGYGRRAEQEAAAAAVAHAELTRLRQWLSTPARFEDPTGFSPEAHPGFTVTVEQPVAARLSPNSTLEAGSGDPRSMAGSFRQVAVRVEWEGSRRLELVSLVGAPPREPSPDPVRLTPAGGWPPLLGRDRTLEVEVEFLDEDGQPVPDVFFTWGVRPVTGVMTLESAQRDGSGAVFVNQAERSDGTLFHTGGLCRVAAEAVYRGRRYQGVSPPISLEGP